MLYFLAEEKQHHRSSIRTWSQRKEGEVQCGGQLRFILEQFNGNKLQDFDNILTVNGQTAVEVDMESLEDKPWRKPGADITDYFNYGFTEETWAAYCNR